MLALDGLWTADTNSMHPRYPPGAPLWQYLFNAFLPASEGKAYFAHFVLLLAPLLVLWNGVRWSQPIWIVGILALVLLAVANFGLGISTLYVDQTIGVWYLGTILAAIADDNLASRRVALYAAPLAVLALLKDAALPFAISGAAILAAVFCCRALERARPRSGLIKTGAALAVLLAPVLLCAQVWSWNRDAAGAPREVYSLSGIVGGIAGGTAAADAARDAELTRRLTEVFFDQQLSNGSATWEQQRIHLWDARPIHGFLSADDLRSAGRIRSLVGAHRLLAPDARVAQQLAARRWRRARHGNCIHSIAALELSVRFRRTGARRCRRTCATCTSSHCRCSCSRSARCYRRSGEPSATASGASANGLSRNERRFARRLWSRATVSRRRTSSGSSRRIREFEVRAALEPLSRRFAPTWARRGCGSTIRRTRGTASTAGWCNFCSRRRPP